MGFGAISRHSPPHRVGVRGGVVRVKLNFRACGPLKILNFPRIKRQDLKNFAPAARLNHAFPYGNLILPAAGEMCGCFALYRGETIEL